MMRTTSKLVKALAVVSAVLPFTFAAFAADPPAIVYDNSTTDLGKTYGVNGVEFGDEITLAGTERVVTDFRFEYFLQGSASGASAVLKFYANDGPTVTRTLPDNTTIQVPTPGTLLYTSPVLALDVGFQVAEASQIAIPVPDTFTWTVTFQGVGQGQSVGLRLYDPPTVGSSFADFWQNNNNTWNTFVFDNGATPANFAARVSATAVPEPTTYAYALLAGLSWLGYLGFKRRS